MVNTGRATPRENVGFFILDEKKKQHLDYDAVLEYLTTTYTIITFTDTERSYIYKNPDGTYFEDTTNSTIKKELKNILGSGFKKSYAEETIYQAKILTYADREESEPSEEYLNLKNGILNLETLELIPHSPEYFFTTRSETEYNPEAKAETFLKFIADLGLSEPKLKTLQEFSGYLLLNSPKHKKSIFLYGPTDSGKTTFTKAILNVIGHQNTCSIPIQRLDGRFQEQRLYQKRVNVVGDLGSEAFKSVAMFKRTTGGDIIEAEVKGANNTIKFVWNGKHWFDANDLPDPQGDADTDAFYNRLLMIPFTKTIPKDQQDRDLPTKLQDPTELSGILNWMIEGLHRLEEQGDFTEKTEITMIREHYKRASNTVYCFVNDLCKVENGSYIHKGETFRLYADYCINNNFSQIGKSKFYEQLQANLPAISSEKKDIEGLGLVHVFFNLEIEGADVSKVSKISTLSPIPPTANNTTPTTSQEPYYTDSPSNYTKNKEEKVSIEARGGMAECVEKLEKLEKPDTPRRFECDQCACWFGTQQDLDSHKAAHLKGPLPGDKTKPQTEEPTPEPKPEPKSSIGESRLYPQLQEVLEAMRGGAETEKQVSENTEIPLEGVKGLFKVLVRDGTIYQSRPGVWRLSQ